MTKIIIYQANLDEVGEEELQALLDELECDEVEFVAFSDDEAECSEILDDCDAIIIILAPGMGDDAVLATVLRIAATKNCRVVSVWPRGSTGFDLPEPIESYGTDVLPWDGAKINGAACGDADPSFENPDGEPREEPETERNLCP